MTELNLALGVGTGEHIWLAVSPAEVLARDEELQNRLNTLAPKNPNWIPEFRGGGIEFIYRSENITQLFPLAGRLTVEAVRVITEAGHEVKVHNRLIMLESGDGVFANLQARS